MTNEHKLVMLDAESESDALAKAAAKLARAAVPAAVSDAMRIGRMVELANRGGVAWGIVIGDELRRLVARTLVQQCAGWLAQACAPFQFSLSTRVSTEGVAHAVQFQTEADLARGCVDCWDRSIRSDLQEGDS